MKRPMFASIGPFFLNESRCERLSMKVIPLNCNHCSAPLEVAAKAKFVTCGFCKTRLSIQQTGSTYSTEVLEDLKEATEQIARDVEAIKHSATIERLDRQWERDRMSHMVTNKHGQHSLPTKGGAMVVGGMVVGFGILWTVIATGISTAASSMGAPGVFRIIPMVFPLFGVLFVGFGIFNIVSMVKKSEAYESRHRDNMQKRRELVSKQRQLDDDS